MNGGNQLQLQVLILVDLSNHYSYRIRPFWINLEFFRCKTRKTRLIFKNAETALIAIGVYFWGNALYFPSALFSPLRSHWPATDCFRAFGPKSGKIVEEWIFASPGKWGKNGRKMGKIARKWLKKLSFLVDFSFFQPFIRPFAWWGHNPFFGHFPPISSRRPEISL